MSSALKAILIIFLSYGCLLHPAGSFAQNAASPGDSTAEAGYNSETDAGPQTGEDEDVTYSDESYNETNFDKASGVSAATQRDISEDRWRQMTSDPAFRYEDEKEEPVRPSENWWSRMFGALFSFLASTAGQALVILVVVAVVVVLIVRYFQANGNIFFSRKDKKLGDAGDGDEEEYIPEDWEKEIAEAARTGNYRLALRFCYRFLLLNLQEKGLINYQAAKTNYQYVFELSGTRLHKPFMKLTRDYEYAWYGGFEIDRTFYDAYYQMTREVQQQLTHQGSFEA